MGNWIIFGRNCTWECVYHNFSPTTKQILNILSGVGELIWVKTFTAQVYYSYFEFNWLKISPFRLKSNVLGWDMVFWRWNLYSANPRTCSGGHCYCWCHSDRLEPLNHRQQPYWHISTGASLDLQSHLNSLHICLTEYCFVFFGCWCKFFWLILKKVIGIFCLKYLLCNCFALNVCIYLLVSFACPKLKFFDRKHFVFVNLYLSYRQFEYPLIWPKHSFAKWSSGDES